MQDAWEFLQTLFNMKREFFQNNEDQKLSLNLNLYNQEKFFKSGLLHP